MEQCKEGENEKANENTHYQCSRREGEKAIREG